MTIFVPTKTLESTPFSEFFRNAPSTEKKRVYARVLKNATERQLRQMSRVNNFVDAGS